MKFWHIVEDSKGTIREQHIYNDNKKRFSLECLETVLKGSYKIIPQKIQNNNKKTIIMKTKTGLTIIHDGNRVNVYTQDEMRKHNDENKIETWISSVLSYLNIKR